MQNLHLLEFLTEAFRCHVHHYQCLAGDEVHYPVHGGYDSRDVSVVIACDCVKECMSYVTKTVKIIKTNFAEHIFNTRHTYNNTETNLEILQQRPQTKPHPTI